MWFVVVKCLHLNREKSYHLSTNRYISLTEECIQLNTAFTAISNCLWESGLDDQIRHLSGSWLGQILTPKYSLEIWIFTKTAKYWHMLQLESLGQHLDIARGSSLLIFTALLDFFLLYSFLHFLFLLGTFRSLWSLGCPLTALGLLGTSAEKSAVKIIFQDGK